MYIFHAIKQMNVSQDSSVLHSAFLSTCYARLQRTAEAGRDGGEDAGAAVQQGFELEAACGGGEAEVEVVGPVEAGGRVLPAAVTNATKSLPGISVSKVCKTVSSFNKLEF